MAIGADICDTQSYPRFLAVVVTQVGFAVQASWKQFQRGTAVACGGRISESCIWVGTHIYCTTDFWFTLCIVALGIVNLLSVSSVVVGGLLEFRNAREDSSHQTCPAPFG